jgi:iron complex outermembrane recepter protein
VICGGLAVAWLLLAGSPAQAAQDGPLLVGTVMTRDGGLPLPGARVSVPALGLSTTADADGHYRLSLPAHAPGRRLEVWANASGLQPHKTAVVVLADVTNLDFSLGLGFHEELMVGSRAPGTAGERAVPVDVLTQRQLGTTGASETSQIVEALAPSFNFPRTSLADGADTVRPATLRGLGPDQLLVLLNGKRRHQGAHIVTSGVIGRGTTGVDLNAVPASALGRIEVLRDGSSAQYGSDAIAGVLNLVLRSGEQPWTLTAKTGLTLGDFTDLTGARRDFSDGELTEATVSRGFKVKDGSVLVTAEYRNRNGTNRASPDPRDQLAPGDAGRNPVPQPNHHWGDAEERDILGFVNASLPLGASGTTVLYGFGGASRRDGSHGGFYRRALDARNWPDIYPLGFLPTLVPEVVDGAGTLGVRGVAGEWFWDVSAEYGRNRLDFDVVNSLNASLGPGLPPNQTTFHSGRLAADQVVANADASRALELGLARRVNLAVGAEYRHEGFRQEAGEPASYEDGGFANQFGGRAEAGAQVFPGFRPENAADAGRRSVAFFADLEGDLRSGLRLGLAGRFEHFSDFGQTLDGKATLRFAPVPRLVLRAAASTGFRAPSLAQSHFSSVATNFISVGGAVVPVEVGTFAVDSAVARALGATDLRPEQSLHLSGGLAWMPMDGFEAALDFYRIAIDDRVVLSGNFTGPRIEALLRPLGANGGRFFSNAIDTTTRGFDLTAAWQRTVGETGRLGLTASYNRTENEIGDTVATPPPLAGLENVLFDRVETMRLVCGQPGSSLRLGADWNARPLGAVLRASRYGEYCFASGSAASDQTFGAKWLVDVELSYRRGRLGYALGAQNAFDVMPDRLSPANSSFQVQTFPNTSPFGFNGRFLYVKVTLRL